LSKLIVTCQSEVYFLVQEPYQLVLLVNRTS